MGHPAKRGATYEDLLNVPPHRVAEIIDGELHTSPRPALPHAGASSSLGYLLSGPFRFGIGGPGGWIILDEPELHLHANVVVPDLAGWRRERMPELPKGPAMELAPDWLCEVLSPSTEARDRADKLPLYARESVGHVWLINPELRTLEVLRRQETQWVLVAIWKGESKVRAEPFEAIELDMALLWAL